MLQPATNTEIPKLAKTNVREDRVEEVWNVIQPNHVEVWTVIQTMTRLMPRYDQVEQYIHSSTKLEIQCIEKSYLYICQNNEAKNINLDEVIIIIIILTSLFPD